MRVLLDTHCWLWMLAAPERLSARALCLVDDPQGELLLSAASAWEIAIKYAVGKLALPEPPARFVPSRMERSGVLPLPVSHAHAAHVAELPPHHRDPFDRLLIAQAELEGLPLLTVDRAFAAYGIELIWAD